MNLMNSLNHFPSLFKAIVSAVSAALLLAASFCFLATPALAQETLYSQEYKTKIEGIPITTTRSLIKLKDGTYRFRIRSSNFVAKFDESSYYEILEDGSYRPIRNQSERKIFGVSSESETRFDWDNMIATFERDDDPIKEVTIEPGMVDRTLYQYLMEKDMRSALPQLSYDIVDKGRIRNFSFENLGTEELEIGDQKLYAVKLRRITDSERRETIVWMAEERNFEIVKIFHKEDSDSEYTMTINL